jgi:hypothetical protein
VVEKSRTKRSREKRNPRKSEMRQQNAWSRNQKVDEAGARAPAPPPSAAAPSPPAAPPPPDGRADERRSWLCGSRDFIIAAGTRIWAPPLRAPVGSNRIDRSRSSAGGGG